MVEHASEEDIALLRTEVKIARTAISRIQKDIGLLLKTVDDIKIEMEDLASVTDAVRVEVNNMKKLMPRKA